MIPLRDNIPPRTFPFINYLMIGLCTLAFVAQLMPGGDQLIETLGMIPARVKHPDRPVVIKEPVIVETAFGYERGIRERTAAESPLSPWLTLLTCIFLHGGWMHFLGNMWFLHIFGDNVEDRLGHMGYLIFYLAAGVAASATQLLAAPESTLPTIGASGAIAGVMGAYLLLYPRAHVLALLPIFVFMQVFVVPAPVFLVVWFALQFFQGALSVTSSETGGVAWWAHIGGFAVGFVVAWFVKKSGFCAPPVENVLPQTERFSHYRYQPRRRLP